MTWEPVMQFGFFTTLHHCVSLVSFTLIGYIGPGAGFALAGSFMAVFGAIGVVVSSFGLTCFAQCF